VDGTVVTADCLEGVADRTFDRVLCNPPTHAGADVLAELFDGAHGVLAAAGRLEVVHHRALDLRRYLSRFDAIDRVRTGAEHVVLRATG
jgi:16S rRNA (guanine1207-N2)-methyltransferase